MNDDAQIWRGRALRAEAALAEIRETLTEEKRNITMPAALSPPFWTHHRYVTAWTRVKPEMGLCAPPERAR